ncbi:hypothetical protein FB451DRAFT_1162708 [Mycena latifolia]|nr:hypothetical protein FB451DRAFT_1162708 [Mycena latifolia]
MLDPSQITVPPDPSNVVDARPNSRTIPSYSGSCCPRSLSCCICEDACNANDWFCAWYRLNSFQTSSATPVDAFLLVIVLHPASSSDIITISHTRFIDSGLVTDLVFRDRPRPPWCLLPRIVHSKERGRWATEHTDCMDSIAREALERLQSWRFSRLHPAWKVASHPLTFAPWIHPPPPTPSPPATHTIVLISARAPRLSAFISNVPPIRKKRRLSLPQSTSTWRAAYAASYAAAAYTTLSEVAISGPVTEKGWWRRTSPGSRQEKKGPVVAVTEIILLGRDWRKYVPCTENEAADAPLIPERVDEAEAESLREVA